MFSRFNNAEQHSSAMFWWKLVLVLMFFGLEIFTADISARERYPECLEVGDDCPLNLNKKPVR